MTNHHQPPLSKARYAGLSIAAALLTIVLKFGAYLLTDSVSLFSDAAESVVNLLAALMALWMLIVASRPPDEEHAFGHSKAEYFSSGIEGALIMLAAASIAYTASGRLFNPQPIQKIDIGLILAIVAALINGGVALILLRAGRRMHSIALQADAHHLLTDVWTTGGVVIGVLLVRFTGWLILDPLIAIAVAFNIIWAGWRLLRETGYGLLDSALPADEQALITKVLDTYRQQGLMFHALRTRRAGVRRFVSFHVLVPGHWSVHAGHDICEQIELAIAVELPDCNVITHLEPLEDPIAWDDQELDRVLPEQPA